MNEYRHILKGSEVEINKGLEMVKELTLPEGYGFADSFLFQLGIGEKTIEDAKRLQAEMMECA